MMLATNRVHDTFPWKNHGNQEPHHHSEIDTMQTSKERDQPANTLCYIVKEDASNSYNTKLHR
eukprot:scaffold8671_cov112-Skeletonema_dohrnii-CCMP3373.AAC.8